MRPRIASPALLALLTWLSSILLCDGQFPPPATDDDLTTIYSPVDGNITITYKSPPVGTCTTVFETQKQYTGYITLPPNTLVPTQGNYTINTFFWFIEARQDPDIAPLTIFINGGPGSSSMVGLFQEVGPCQVVEVSKDQLGTMARDWGWDRSSNIIFIDQPVQVGFSFDVLVNSSLNLIDEVTVTPPTSVPITQPAYSFLNGTFSSGNSAFTANTSHIAAQAIWHFLQGFLGTFPQYNPGTRSDDDGGDGYVGINLFTESYGGKFGPAIASFLESQNALRYITPSMYNTTLEIGLLTLGIFNGWIDLFTQMPLYPQFAYNNTYDYQAISQVEELNALSAYTAADGCQQLAITCRAEGTSLDPSDTGNISSVNSDCVNAQDFCEQYVIGPYTLSGRSVYDISQNVLDPFPDSHYLEYLNIAAVQQAIGVPVNYTQTSQAVFSAFLMTGDYARDDVIADLVKLLDSGVRVALIYGDRDYICNWLGGEAISFAIAGAAGPSYAPWYSAGYSPIVANESYIGGVVREHGNLSFSRVYDAGHLVAAYQPETAFTIFSRIIEGTDISLGTAIDLSTYGSYGDANASHTNILPPMASPICYLRSVNHTCDTDQKNMLANNAGVIINGVLYDSESDWVAPSNSISSMAGIPGTAPISMITSAPSAVSSKASVSKTADSSAGHSSNGLGMPFSSGLPTGVYTATAVPTTTTSTSSGSATAVVQSHVKMFSLMMLLYVCNVCG